MVLRVCNTVQRENDSLCLTGGTWFCVRIEFYFAVSQIRSRYAVKIMTLSPLVSGRLPHFGYLGSTWFGTVSTILSHRSAFTFKEYPDRINSEALCTMGYILDTPSGKFKTLLVDTVEKLSCRWHT